MTITEAPNNFLTEILKEQASGNFEKIIQTIPKELLNELQQTAKEKGVSLNQEVITRIMATIIEPNAFGISKRLDELLNRKFTETEMRAEINARQKAWIYVYEIEKLKLFVELECNLPKNFTDSFNIINVAKEIDVLRKEKALRDQNKPKDEE